MPNPNKMPEFVFLRQEIALTPENGQWRINPVKGHEIRYKRDDDHVMGDHCGLIDQASKNTVAALSKQLDSLLYEAISEVFGEEAVEPDQLRERAQAVMRQDGVKEFYIDGTLLLSIYPPENMKPDSLTHVQWGFKYKRHV